MVEITPLLYVIIPGFIYLSALFFTFLIVTRRYKKRLNKDLYKEYLPYIAIIAIFFSYILGHTINLFTEVVITCGNSELQTYAADLYTNEEISIRALQAIDHSQASLVMIRHLIASTFFLGLFLLIWLWNSLYSKLKWYFIIVFSSLIVIFIYAYCFERTNLINIKNKVHNQSQGLNNNNIPAQIKN